MSVSTTARRWADIAERAIWTLIQAGVGEAIVLALDLDPVWVVPIAAALAAVKGALASKFGTKSAATLPVELDAAAAPAEPTPPPPPPPPTGVYRSETVE